VRHPIDINGYDYSTSREPSDFSENVLTRDVAFNRHSKNQEGTHVSPFDQGHIDVGTDDIKVRLVQGINERDFARVLKKAQMATIGLDIEAADDDDEGWEEMLKGGLQTALESQTIVFEVQGVSRTATHQIVRSRRAAFHQQSQRASWMGVHPNVRMPESVWRNHHVRDAWYRAINACHEAYSAACAQDISYQDARFILPEGTSTYIMCEYTVREFLAVYAYRACSMFQWEICHTVREMGRLLVEAHPWLAPYVKITCEKTHVCEFQGWEKVEGQCTLPYAIEENRRYKPHKSLQIK
jgi:thymidylate synthase (FAD)